MLMIRLRTTVMITMATLLFSGPAVAQLASDRIPRERTVPIAETLERDLGIARRFGPLRLIPMVELSNFGYNSNVFGTPENPESDFTASIGAGARYIVPMGRKLFLRGDLMPEYTWYQELEENRFLGGRYSGSLLALGNRISLEASGATSNRLQLVSSESEIPAEQRLDVFSVETEVDVLTRLSVFGSWRANEYSFDSSGDESSEIERFERLEREESAVRGGVRYRVRSFFDVSAAVERTQSEFRLESDQRNNTTEAVLVGLGYTRPRLFVNAVVGQRQGRAENSEFPEYDEITGSWFGSYRLTAPVELSLYGNRSAVFSEFVSNPYFLETRNGAAVRFRTGGRIVWNIRGEAGANDYPRPVLVGGESVVFRSDDAITYGAGFAVRLWRNVNMIVNATQTTYDSNIDRFDRDVFRVTTGLDFSGGSFLP